MDEKLNSRIYHGSFYGDIDSLDIEPGSYRINEPSSYTHASLTAQGYNPSWCEFYQSPALHTQVIFTRSAILTRGYTGNPEAWNPWRILDNTAALDSKYGNNFCLHTALVRSSSEINRLKITMANIPYAYMTGIILTRYGCFGFTLYQDGSSTVYASCGKLFSRDNEALTATVSSHTGLFRSSIGWNHFGVIYVTERPESDFSFAGDKVT